MFHGSGRWVRTLRVLVGGGTSPARLLWYPLSPQSVAWMLTSTVTNRSRFGGVAVELDPKRCCFGSVRWARTLEAVVGYGWWELTGQILKTSIGTAV